MPLFLLIWNFTVHTVYSFYHIHPSPSLVSSVGKTYLLGCRANMGLSKPTHYQLSYAGILHHSTLRRAHSLAGEGVGESQFRRGDTVVPHRYMYFVVYWHKNGAFPRTLWTVRFFFIIKASGKVTMTKELLINVSNWYIRNRDVVLRTITLKLCYDMFCAEPLEL
jgi:hypothetical protein